ncbi:MAG: hypothetical protein OCD00_19970 [Colwellia sp.]
MLRAILVIIFFYFGVAYAETNKTYPVSEVINNKNFEGKIYVSGFYFSDAIFKDKKSAYEFSDAYLLISIKILISIFIKNV